MVMGCADPEPLGPTVSASVRTRVTVYGEPDGRDFSIVLSSADRGQIAAGSVGGNGGSYIFWNLAAATYSVGLEWPATECRTEGDNPQAVMVEGPGLDDVDFIVSCRGPGVVGVWERRDPLESEPERFYLSEDATFLLDFGAQDDRGTYVRTDTSFVFTFFNEHDPGWEAVGRLHGSCISVVYGADLAFDLGYRDGEYCELDDA